MKKFDPVESYASARHEFGEHGGVNMSIASSTTFTVIDPNTMPEIFDGLRGPDTGGCYLYGRHFNPTVYVLGREIAAIEGTEAAYCAASGMGAIVAALMQICDHGDHIVSGHTVYGGTFALLSDFLPAKAGVTTTFVDMTNHAEVEAAFTERTKLLYVEAMSNPTLAVADIPRLAEIAHQRGALLVVDNTFCPLILSPAQHGADVVVHSLTKFISGSSDHIGGVICGSKEFVTSLMDLHLGALMLLGPTMDPRVAFNLSLRLPHLPLRVTEHSARAQLFAERMVERGLPVTYPGLPDHPQHQLLAELANPGFGYGGLLGIDAGTQARAFELMDILQNRHQFGYLAVSLGYHATLMSCSAASTSSELSPADLERAGIAPGLVRMAIGYTGSREQRWAQLEDALQSVGLIS